VARVKELTKFPSVEEEQRIIAGLRWIGLFDKTAPVTPRGNLLDTLCATLEQKMQYEKGERDMVMLQHSALFFVLFFCRPSSLIDRWRHAEFLIEHADGSKETRTSTLLDYGAPFHTQSGPSSMAKLVGVPCGIAVQLILDGVINTPGVLAPYEMDIVQPLLEAVEKEGITMVEKTV
jgi:saccharopine dehydrogenase-like NADP-dependent oxidoreductase